MRTFNSLAYCFKLGIQLLNKHHFGTNSNLKFSVAYFSTKVEWGSKKLNRKVKLHFSLDTMADPKIEEILAPLRASVKEQVSKMIFNVPK